MRSEAPQEHAKVIIEPGGVVLIGVVTCIRDLDVRDAFVSRPAPHLPSEPTHRVTSTTHEQRRHVVVARTADQEVRECSPHHSRIRRVKETGRGIRVLPRRRQRRGSCGHLSANPLPRRHLHERTRDRHLGAPPSRRNRVAGTPDQHHSPNPTGSGPNKVLDDVAAQRLTDENHRFGRCRVKDPLEVVRQDVRRECASRLGETVPANVPRHHAMIARESGDLLVEEVVVETETVGECDDRRAARTRHPDVQVTPMAPNPRRGAQPRFLSALRICRAIVAFIS